MRGIRLAAVAVAAAGAIGGAAAAPAQSVRDGVDAWQRGDYAVAVRDWRPLAEKGDGDAAFDLAQAYKLGRGVPLDMAQAKTWYGAAARAGHPQGIANYGLLLFQDGQRREAIPWIDKASAAGDPRAQYVMGTALFNGDLAAKDWPRAYGLMTRAAAAGLPQATTSLTQMDRFLSAADKAKGTQLAERMAAQPMPPIGRQLVTSGKTEAAATKLAATDAPAARAAPPAKAEPRAKEPAARPAAAVVAAAKPATATAKPASGATKPLSAGAGGAWQVQLGAFGSEAAARTEWGKIAGKAPALKALRPSYVKAGAVVRLRATGLADRAAAEKACAAAKSAGAACFPVPGGA